MTKPRNPHANNNLTSARISDITKARLYRLAERLGCSKTQATRAAIEAGLDALNVETPQGGNAKKGD